MSKHLLGMAVDVYPLEADLEYVKRDVLELPIGGIGIYGSFVHIDVYGANRRWQGE